MSTKTIDRPRSARDLAAPPTGDTTDFALRALVESQPLWRERYRGWVELGTGSSATVIRTRNRDLGQDVAVKVFHRPMDRRRFQQEVRNARLLDSSPYTVRVHSPFWGTPPWIEMEYVDGPSLAAELDRRGGEPFPLVEALDIGIGLATVLQEAHRRHVVHRDIKPANILLPRSGAPVVKVVDFGVSRYEDAAISTASGTLRGTPQFASPEAFVGEDSPGAPHDVYGLGLCLYLMMTGRFPWRIRPNADAMYFMGCHLNVPPAPPRSQHPQLDSDIDFLLFRALAKEPHRRPRAHQVLEALRAVRSRLPDRRSR